MFVSNVAGHRQVSTEGYARSSPALLVRGQSIDTVQMLDQISQWRATCTAAVCGLNIFRSVPHCNIHVKSQVLIAASKAVEARIDAMLAKMG